MSSFLNQKLGQTFGQTVQSLGQPSNVELKVGSHTLLVKERVAEGGFGFVDLVTEVHTKKDYVLKRCNVDREAAFSTVKKEINILQRFAGPYMVELIDSDIITKNRTSREALLLLDFCPGGHLLERLNSRNGNPLPAESVFRIFGQLLLAMKPMHESRPSVVHRDLKLENILFGADGKLRLCDFGSCVEGNIPINNATEREAAEEVIQKETTQMYRAPEMVDLYMRTVLTEKTDIWALGCILYALCFLKHPIQDAGPLGILSAKIVFPANSSFSADTHAFILKMLDVDPEARLSIAQCLECTAALAGNRPLPEFPLSPEAAQRRAERIAANELRQNKQKKVVVAAPRKVVAPLDSNSVAARRLAAKRGGVGESSPRAPVTSNRQTQSKSPEFEVSFDAFPTSNTVKSHSTEFADFHDEPIRAASNKISNANSLFDDDEEEEAAVPNSPPPVAAFTSNKSVDQTFDAFASDNTSVSTFDAFAAAPAAFMSSKSTHSVTFDAFDDPLVDFDTPAAASSSSNFSSFDDHSSFTPSTDAFSATVTSSGFGQSVHDPFGAAPTVPVNSVAKPAKPFNRRSSFATAAPVVPVDTFDLLDVDDVSEAPRLSTSHSQSIDFDLISDHAESTSGRASFSSPTTSSSSSVLQTPNFMDDLLIPQQVAPVTPHQYSQQQQHHQPEQRRSVSSKDPNSVLSLFDQPPPEKPPKPVMLNTPSHMMPGGQMMGGSRGPMNVNRGMGGPGPMGGAAGGGGGQSPGMYGQFSPHGAMGGGGPMSGGRGPGQQQQGQLYTSPAPSPHQQFTPGAQRTMQSAAYPLIQTNKTIDPFDSINHYGPSSSGRR